VPVEKASAEGTRGIYMPPTSDDSRSPCPALNTLANHGILPRDGKKIQFTHIASALQRAYNLSPTLAWQLTASSFPFANGGNCIDLGNLCAHNVIEHDASFTRQDIALNPDQSKPDAELIDTFLNYASDQNKLTLGDMSRFSGVRRYSSRLSNGQYTLSPLHTFFGSGNCALMYDVFGGDTKDLRVWLVDERFPKNWEPKNKLYYGSTIINAQYYSWLIELGVVEGPLEKLSNTTQG